MCATGGVAAQTPAPADSYRVGDRVEVRPAPSKEAWEPGVVTDFTYDTGQLVVRFPTNERAFEDKDVRRPAAQAAPAPAHKPGRQPRQHVPHDRGHTAGRRPGRRHAQGARSGR